VKVRKPEDFKDKTCQIIWNLHHTMLTTRHATALLLLHFYGVEVIRYEVDEQGFWKEGWWVMPARQACKIAREKGFTYVRKRSMPDYWKHPTNGGLTVWNALKGYGFNLTIPKGTS
jgi:hypothetical protein